MLFWAESVRWALSGTRKVFMVNAATTNSFLEKTPPASAKALRNCLSCSKACPWLVLCSRQPCKFCLPGCRYLPAASLDGCGAHNWSGLLGCFMVDVPCLTLTQCQNLKGVSNKWVEGDSVVQKMLKWGEQLLAPRAWLLARWSSVWRTPCIFAR